MYNFFKNANSEVVSSFQRLTSYLEKHEPINLLSQLTLTYLFSPQEKQIEEVDELTRWQVWIELLCGYLFSKPFNEKSSKIPNGCNLSELENILTQYYNGLTRSLINSKKSHKAEHGDLLAFCKFNSLYVRGDSYPSKLIETAQGLYSPHDKWFKDNLGFTINDCIELFEIIKHKLMNDRVNNELFDCRETAETEINRLIVKKKIPRKNKEKLEASLFCQLYFGNAHNVLSFTLDELVTISKKDKYVCEKFLQRLSQSFGYKNPKHTNVFIDPFKLPWDFNSLYEKPILKFQDKYYLFVPPIIPTVILSTFNFDLMGDSSYYQKFSFEKGKFVEQRTAQALKSVFPEHEVFLNPHYMNNEEFCDVLILRDRKIYIIQCKSKQMSYESKIGANIDDLINDLKKGIAESFEQAKRARDHINSTPIPEIKISDSRSIGIDRNQLTDVFLVSVTLGHYQGLVTRLANIDKNLGLFQTNEFPWAISLHDLEILTHLMDSPSQFIHYTKKRLEVEHIEPQLIADEIDLMDLYFDQNLDLKSGGMKKFNLMVFTGYSNETNKYFMSKFEFGLNVEKPQQKMTAKLKQFLNEVESLNSPYKTDCIITLLNFPFADREKFMELYEQRKEEVVKTNKILAVNFFNKLYSVGVSFVAMEAEGDIERLFRQTSGMSILNKHKLQAKEWAGFGWDVASRRLVDVACYLYYQPFKDDKISQISKRIITKSEYYGRDGGVSSFS